jgi:hypothetical protein
MPFWFELLGVRFFKMCPCLPSCCSLQLNASCWLLLLWLLLLLLLMCNINHALVTVSFIHGHVPTQQNGDFE